LLTPDRDLLEMTDSWAEPSGRERRERLSLNRVGLGAAEVAARNA